MKTCRQCGCTEITPCLSPVEGARGWQPCGWADVVAIELTGRTEPLCTSCAGGTGLTYEEWTGALAQALEEKRAQPPPPPPPGPPDPPRPPRHRPVS